MRGPHIAFIVESAHGHINPTLAVATELTKRGYRISYAVKEYFVPRVVSSGAQALVYRPLEAKFTLFREMEKDPNGAFPFDFSRIANDKNVSLLRLEREDTLSQLRMLYQDDRPDLIIYDQGNLAGRSLASEWSIACCEYAQSMIDTEKTDGHDANLVIVSLPKFFQTNATALDNRRFHFIGPIYNQGKFFKPWRSASSSEQTILVSATTGLLPEADIFLTAICAFENTPFRVVLSIGDELDPGSLGRLPDNCEINQFSSQQEILQHCCLFIGHGGPSSTFEALRFGVPPILIPPSQFHDPYARRIEELGLGIRLLKDTFSADKLRESAASLLEDGATLSRLKQIQKTIGEIDGPGSAADLIHQYSSGETSYVSRASLHSRSKGSKE